MADIAVQEVFRTRRVAGAALVFIALPSTLIWLRFGLPMQFVLADFVLVLGGPGLLSLGLWAAFPRRRPAVRLIISDARLVVHPGARQTEISLDDLIRVTKVRPLMAKCDRLVFECADTKTRLNVIHLTHEAADIIALVSIRLEDRGKYLVEGRSDVLGALTGVWDVVTGDPFEKRG